MYRPFARDTDNSVQNPVWNYRVVPETRHNTDLGEFDTYAIELTGPNCEYTMHDVSVCGKTAGRIAVLLNLHQLYPCHFMDAVEDLLP